MAIDLNTLNEVELTRLMRIMTPKLNKYMPHTPTNKQAAFLLLDNREAFYGGAAGGGKSDALLMAALQYVDEPSYAAILFRKTYSDLALPGALIDRAKQWLGPFEKQGVRWVEKEKTWHFPSGATMSFGYLENDNDKYRYQSSEFQFIGFDELTQLLKSVYTYMFSRLRRLKSSPVPLRVRSASNPGNEGHEWVRQRFLVEGPDKGRIFIPASLSDNPYLDAESYREGLDELDLVTKAQLKDGNWDVKRVGAMFDRDWFEIVPHAPAGIRNVRFWDMAATEVKKGKDPDWTAGVKLGEKDGIYYIMHCKRFRKTPADNEAELKISAVLDGKQTSIYMEQEPGSSGLTAIDHYARNVLRGFHFEGHYATGNKVTRANPVSSAAQQGRVKMVYGKWNSDMLDELEMFPAGRHDDQVDGLSGAFDKLHTIDYSMPIAVGEQVSYWDEDEMSGYNAE